jgi:steroid 5-alpha reductase family enzyme
VSFIAAEGAIPRHVLITGMAMAWGFRLSNHIGRRKWGIFLVAASTPWGWVTVFSPLLMTFFLLKVSGVPLLEEALAERREGYREYMERTRSFVPWPPKKG